MKYKICIVTTMSSSIDNWVKPFFQAYKENQFDVTVACNMSESYMEKIKKEFPHIKPVNIQMPRGISLLGSIKAIYQLYQLFSKEKFDLIQYSTPNASFYSAIASYFAKIPQRLYCQWGMVFVSMSGFKRSIFEFIERTTCKLSTEVQPDSHGNLDFCRQNHFYSEQKSRVIWNGSAKGVDLERYDISKKEMYKTEIRERYRISEDSAVLGFVGRLGAEKGCNELFNAFKSLNEKNKNLKLLFVGPLEKEGTIEPELLKWFYENDHIIKTDRVPDVEKHMAAMDIFILPSYREGFGMSVVEAEAMGVPVIVTNIPGPINGMLPNETGMVIPVKSSLAIIDAVTKMLDDDHLRLQMGKKSREFAEKNFDSKKFAKMLLSNRVSLVQQRSLEG